MLFLAWSKICALGGSPAYTKSQMVGRCKWAAVCCVKPDIGLAWRDLTKNVGSGWCGDYHNVCCQFLQGPMQAAWDGCRAYFKLGPALLPQAATQVCACRGEYQPKALLEVASYAVSSESSQMCIPVAVRFPHHVPSLVQVPIPLYDKPDKRLVNRPCNDFQQRLGFLGCC